MLVPAIMALLGTAGWWFPKWLERVTPNFSIEGNEWFAERDAPPLTQTESPKAESPQADASQTEASRSKASQAEGPQETPDTHNEPTRTD